MVATDLWNSLPGEAQFYPRIQILREHVKTIVLRMAFGLALCFSFRVKKSPFHRKKTTLLQQLCVCVSVRERVTQFTPHQTMVTDIELWLGALSELTKLHFVISWQTQNWNLFIY